MYKKNSKKTYDKIILLSLFFSFLMGVINSRHLLGKIGILAEYLILFIAISIFAFCLIKNNMKIKKSSIFILPLLVVFVFKILITFIIDYRVIFPDILIPSNPDLGLKFKDIKTLVICFLAALIPINLIDDFDLLSKSILSFGLGYSFTIIITILLFPYQIGVRNLDLWNSAVIGLITVFWLLIAVKPFIKFKKIINLILFLLLFGVLSGLSRSGLLAIVVSLGMYLIIYLVKLFKTRDNNLIVYKKHLQKIIYILFFVLIIILFILFLNPDFIVKTFNELINTDISEETRIRVWTSYLNNFTKYFKFGNPFLEGNFRRFSFDGIHGPHSVFLNWLVQFGIFGLLSFFYLIFGFFYTLKYVKFNFKSFTMYIALFSWIIAYFSVATINQTGFNEFSVFYSYGLFLSFYGKKANEYK